MDQNELQQALAGIDLSQVQTVICTHCNGKTWVQAFKLNRLSPIISPTGEELIFPSPLFKCSDCGKLIDETDEK